MIYARPCNGHPFLEVTKAAALEWAALSVNNTLRKTRVWCDREVWLLGCEDHVGEDLTK